MHNIGNKSLNVVNDTLQYWVGEGVTTKKR